MEGLRFLKDTEALGYIVMGISRMGYGLEVIFQAMDVAQNMLSQTDRKSVV